MSLRFWRPHRLGQVTSRLGLCGLSRLSKLLMPTFCDPHAELAASPAYKLARGGSKVSTSSALRIQEGVGEVSALASHGITPVEHDDDNEHRPGINEPGYVIRNNGDALSAGVPKFFMSVARHYRHQA
jgi:hypothetical protein